MDLNRHQKWMLARFSAYGFLRNLRFFEPLILLYFTVAKGLSYTQFGALVAVREVAIYVLEIPTGVLADVTGRRRVMVGAFGAYIVSFGLFTWGDGFWVFVPAMIFFAGGEALRSGTHKALIMEHLDREGLADQKVHYYGYTRSMSRLGAAVSALAVGLFAFLGGDYALVFPATIIPYFLGLLLMLTYPAELDGKRKTDVEMKDVWTHLRDSYKSLIRTSQLGKVVINASFFDAFFRVGKDYLQPVVKAAALGLPVLAAFGNVQQRTFLLIGGVYFLIYLNSFVSSRLSGHLVDRGQRDLARTLNVLFGALGLVFIAAGTLLRFEHAIGAVLVLFFLYTLYNLRKPAVVGFLSERIPKKQRATLLSTENQFRAVFAALVAPALGWVADHPRLGVAWAFLGGGLVLLLVGFALRLKNAH
jgi:MFS family permease